MISQLAEQSRRPLTKYLHSIIGILGDSVAAVHVVGSMALNDYRDGQSDIDFVTVCARPPTYETMGALEELHRELSAESEKPDLDGVYVAARHLLRYADGSAYGSCQGGNFVRERAFNANPVTWHLLNGRSIALFGPDTLKVYDNIAELKAWCKANLQEYWMPLTAELKVKLHHAEHVEDTDVVWGTLGVARIHATIVTGDVISKTDSAEYAITEFGERWRPLMDRVAAFRKGTPERSVEFNASQKRDSVTFMETVIADAL